jgi:hypothetical protein
MGRREGVSTELYQLYLQQQVLRALQGTTAVKPAQLDDVVTTLGPLVYEDENEVRQAIVTLVQAGKVLVARAGHPDSHARGLGPNCRLWLHEGLATP